MLRIVAGFLSRFILASGGTFLVSVGIACYVQNEPQALLLLGTGCLLIGCLAGMYE